MKNKLNLVWSLIVFPLHFSVFAQSPEWVKSAVFYQIFPERFRNGSAGNDPKAIDIQHSWPHVQPAGWRTADWTADWYAQADWEKATGKDFYFTVQLRRYGGDLQGVIDKLDYLQELGISAIYFNPLFESPSLHKYDQTYYHHIDNNFGPNPDGDRQKWASENPADPATWVWTAADSLFLHLLQQAHKRGIRVIIDGVFNHVGITFWAMQNVQRLQQASPFASWFKIVAWDDPKTPTNEFKYKGWFDVPELPELAQDENGLLPPIREHIFAVVRRWMDPNGDGNPEDGVDGWRLDAAEKVALPFWRQFCKLVRSINPQAYVTGEIWWEDWPHNKIFDPGPWITGDTFDAVMNYRLAVIIKNFLIDKKDKITASEFDRRLTALRTLDGAAVPVMFNLIDSHDTDRLASMVVNPDGWYDHAINPRDNPNYDVQRPGPTARERQELVVAFQMTYPGVPCIYYGSEAGMWGGDDPDDRKPMVWPDLPLSDERSDPLGRPRARDPVFYDKTVYEFYHKLIILRRQSVALQTGEFRPVLADDQTGVFAFERVAKNSAALVVLNSADSTATVELALLQTGKWRLQAGRSIERHESMVSLPPRGYGIWLQE